MRVHAPGERAPFQWEGPDLVFAALILASYFVVPLVLQLGLSALQPNLTLESLSGVQLLLLQGAIHILIIGSIFFLIARVHGEPVLQTLRLVPPRSIAMGRLIVAGAVLALTLVLVSQFFPTPPDTAFDKFRASTPSIALFVFFGIAFAPLVEEIVFRGFIFSVLSDTLGGKAALTITALLFAAMHWEQLQGSLPAVAVILVVGYVLTLARQVSNSVIPSLIIHTAYNATIFVLSGLATIFSAANAPVN